MTIEHVSGPDILWSPYLANSWIRWIPIMFLNCISEEFLSFDGLSLGIRWRIMVSFSFTKHKRRSSVYALKEVLLNQSRWLGSKYHFVEFFNIIWRQFRFAQRSFVVVYHLCLIEFLSPSQLINPTATSIIDND